MQLFRQYGVNMILASHVHQFAEFVQDGIQTYITGGLGAHLALCTCSDCQAFHHVLELEVSEAEIRVTVVRFAGSQVWSKAEGDDDEDNAFPDLRCAEGRRSPRGLVAERRSGFVALDGSVTP